ncbi:MAG: hypothetical protein KGI27_11850 [Thaumarchaeota archaeon]|nr:hypothetical protein [Nitrososphaerota archaeon]
MSKTFAVICIVLGCKKCDKILYSDLEFLKKHLRTHNHNELHNTAVKLGIIESSYFTGYDFLFDRILEFCIIREDLVA